jgi:hypothetical protein
MMPIENRNDNRFSEFSERSIDSISEVRMKENWGVLPIPKSACRLKPWFLTFCESVAPQFYAERLNRVLTFCFFCACAELVVVSRQKKTRIIKRDLQPGKSIFGYFFGG